MDPLSSLSATLAQQGFLTRSDGLADGIGDSSFTHFARRLGLVQTHRGLWTPPLPPLDLGRAAAAALTLVGAPALITGATALALYGIAEAAEDVEVVVPLGRSPVRREGICVHHTCTYDRIRYQHVRGLPTAAPPRCIADFAAHAKAKQLAVAVANGDRVRKLTVSGLDRELSARRRFPGRGTLRHVVVDMKGEVTHSSQERRARRLLAGAGHRPHRRPLPVLANGSLIAEIDVAFEPLKYGVEVDGPHHLLVEVAAADRARDRRLERAGWTIDRFFWFEIDERPEWFVAEVSRRIVALQSRAGRR